MEENLDQIIPILPGDFFVATHDLKRAEWTDSLQKKHRLANFSELLYEDCFSEIRMGWNPRGLIFEIHIQKEFEECFFPEYRKGDSIELFIDTRDLKNAGFIHRFCHHFVMLPKPIEEISAQEVTVFRTDDRHELCEGKKIHVVSEFKKKSYIVAIHLPEDCLYGYDSSSFDRLGFAYRINARGNINHFNVSSEYLNLEQHPNRWASMQMRMEA